MSDSAAGANASSQTRVRTDFRILFEVVGALVVLLPAIGYLIRFIGFVVLPGLAVVTPAIVAPSVAVAAVTAFSFVLVLSATSIVALRSMTRGAQPGVKQGDARRKLHVVILILAALAIVVSSLIFLPWPGSAIFPIAGLLTGALAARTSIAADELEEIYSNWLRGLVARGIRPPVATSDRLTVAYYLQYAPVRRRLVVTMIVGALSAASMGGLSPGTVAALATVEFVPSASLDNGIYLYLGDRDGTYYLSSCNPRMRRQGEPVHSVASKYLKLITFVDTFGSRRWTTAYDVYKGRAPLWPRMHDLCP